MKVGRNERCPCGSGRKVKRCCGTDVVRERAERAAVAREEAVSLATHFPRLRAGGPEFEAWAASAAGGALPDVLVEEAVAALPDGERNRIVHECAHGQLRAWRGIVADVGDEDLAVDALLAGAVVAAVDERRPLPPIRLLFLDADAQADPATTLSFLLRGGDLWSVVESAVADDALAEWDDGDLDDEDWTPLLAQEAARLRTPWHVERLTELVRRVRSQLPFDGYPETSAAAAAAWDAFERDEGVRVELAALLLESSLPRVQLARAGRLAPAA